VHAPGKILLDVALTVALGGDCLADAAMLRAEPAAYGSVASDPTVSRLIDTLAKAGPKALSAIRSARAKVRRHVLQLAGQDGPAADGLVTIDIDGALVIAHSDKQDATPTWKTLVCDSHQPLVALNFQFVQWCCSAGSPVIGLRGRRCVYRRNEGWNATLPSVHEAAGAPGSPAESVA